MKRSCPDCCRSLPVGAVQFDENHNAICSFCGGIVMPARSNKERTTIKKSTNVTSSSGSYKNPRRQADLMNGTEYSYNNYD